MMDGRHPSPPSGSVATLAVVVIGCLAAAGCGGSTAARPQKVGGTASAPARHAAGSRRAATPSVSQSDVARVDASSDAALAANPGLIAAGAPSDTEIRREIRQARRAGIPLPSGNSTESFLRSASSGAVAGGAVPAGAEIPAAAWNPHLFPIAGWIVPILRWAHQNGWNGTVTSGYRTYAQQARLNAAGRFSAPAGASNHEFTRYPGGAVDVTQPAQLLAVLARYPGRPTLMGGVLGPIDPEHFSATGR